MVEYKHGADPEVFALNRNGNIVLPDRYYDGPDIGGWNTFGAKEFLGYSTRWQRDGAAMEIAYEKPGGCRDMTVPALFYTMSWMDDKMRKANAYMAAPAAAPITKTMLRGAPDDVFEFGCAPDKNAYTMTDNAPEMPDGHLWRYAGGHVHVGCCYATDSGNSSRNEYREGSRQAHAAYILWLDYLIGLSSVGFLGARYAENERIRRDWYGVAGSYREPKHGIEYRVLSARGFLQHPIFVSLWYGLARHEPLGWTHDVDAGKWVTDVLKSFEDLDTVQRVINEHDYEWVWENWPRLTRFYDDVYTGMDGERRGGQWKAMHALMNGAMNGVYFEDDLAHNWGWSVKGFTPKHHGYYQCVFAGLGNLSGSIFPQADVPGSGIVYVAKPWQHPSVDLAHSNSYSHGGKQLIVW